MATRLAKHIRPVKQTTILFFALNGGQPAVILFRFLIQTETEEGEKIGDFSL